MDQLQDSIITEPLRWLGIKVLNPQDFTELIVRFLLNLLVIFIVVNYIYSKNSNRKDFYFSYFSISITIFVLCFLLESVKLELGFALGLFAIFGIIRYRTDPIPIKEMTYLFVIIGISVVNALSNKKVSHVELMFTNAAIILTMWILEKILHLKQENCLVINYENIENINIKRKAELYADIQERTGIKVKRIEIEEINYLRDAAKIKVYHDINDNNGENNTF
ncbi:DUF4956 domain-containing protein [Draconibacterium sp. IB214405]|uniref:DUF4956 domain-containing protein n=1 Tax=Draconibacterium sp. IB214405 TaxID=3097352 RepID=UPI002A18472C|nr:DUF4956 domain-containing protein [Draconibacterium sp. IB214405]MDX8338970.1 DUF4956 domain-containing protein [Draconibacterium sp. IB214405]